MFDKSLQMDLQDFKITSIDNIYTSEEAYNNIKKIIKNRTREKNLFLKYLFDNNIISREMHQELIERVNYDLKISNLYIMGLITHL